MGHWCVADDDDDDAAAAAAADAAAADDDDDDAAAAAASLTIHIRVHTIVERHHLLPLPRFLPLITVFVKCRRVSASKLLHIFNIVTLYHCCNQSLHCTRDAQGAL